MREDWEKEGERETFFQPILRVCRVFCSQIHKYKYTNTNTKIHKYKYKGWKENFFFSQYFVFVESFGVRQKKFYIGFGDNVAPHISNPYPSLYRRRSFRWYIHHPTSTLQEIYVKHFFPNVCYIWAVFKEYI